VTLRGLVVWATVVALVVLLALAVAQLVRALRELKRLLGRVEAFAAHPVVAALEKGEADLRRLEAALAQLEPLLDRALAAVAIIRKGPIPPELVSAGRRAGSGIAAVRALVRR
jgi:hypothetical protein